MNWRVIFGVVLLGLSLSAIRLTIGWWDDESVIGEVHLLRDRQMLSGRQWSGGLGRLVANKPVVVSTRVVEKMFEAMDLNLLFFAGHPNERGGVVESEWIPWWLLPLFVWGVVKAARVWLVVWLFGVVWATNFTVVNGVALAGVLLAVYGAVGVGMYDLFFQIYDALRKRLA